VLPLLGAFIRFGLGLLLIGLDLGIGPIGALHMHGDRFFLRQICAVLK